MYFEENYKMKCFQLLCDIYCPISSFGLINSFGCANLSIFPFFILSIYPHPFSSPSLGRGVGGEAVEG